MQYQLAKAPAADQWIDLLPAGAAQLDAVRVCLRPVSPSAVNAARAALGQADHPIADFAADAGFDAFCRELCRRAIIDWIGIGGADGQPAPLTLDNIDALLADPAILARLQGAYVYPWLTREAEKNASSPLSAGTSPAKTGAKGTARAARKGARAART